MTGTFAYFADGTEKSLPAIEELRLVSRDPVEDARLEEDYFAHNKRVAELLTAKGFGLRGDEPGGVRINR